MAKTLIAMAGRMGSGKWYLLDQKIEHLKTTGNTVYLISYADPIKRILRDSFGLTKAGRVGEYMPAITFSKTFVKHQIVDGLYDVIRALNYKQFDIKEGELKSIIARNYEIYEDEFHAYVVRGHEGHTVDTMKFADSENWDYAYCFRKLGQLLGTELGRSVVDSIWVDTALHKVKQVFKQNLAEYAFIDDLRFMNEYEAILTFEATTPFKSEVWGANASTETRARRRGLSIEELIAQETHSSESGIDEIIARLAPEYVIINEG